MGYRLLGMAVWKGAKWFLRRRYGQYVPSRRVLAAAAVASTIAGLILAQRREASR
jgi:hypothetical protein